MASLWSKLLLVVLVVDWASIEVCGQGVRLMLNGNGYANNSNILIFDIGEGDNALYCVTDNTECCRGSDNPNGGAKGQWYFPGNSAVGILGDPSRTGHFFYRNRGTRVVRLNRRGNPTSPTGLYRCEVPDSSGITQTVYANIVDTLPTTPPPTTTMPPTIAIDLITSSGTNTAGQPFNLTCSTTVEGSTDTPTITWFDGNSMTVPSGGGDTRIVSTVMSSGSSYTSILQFDPLQSSHAGTYTCQVSVGTVREMGSIDVTVVAPSITVMISGGGTPTVEQSYSFTCTVSGADQLNPIITYHWFKTNLETQVRINSSSTLSFTPLRLSDAGQYRCSATVSSIFLTEDIIAMNDTEDLRIAIPTPEVTISAPDTILLGSSPTLTCNIDLSEAVDIEVMVNAVWSGPSGTQLTRTASPAVLTSSQTYTSIVTLSSVNTTDSGVYTCRATVSPQTSFFVTASDEGSGTETISIASVMISIVSFGTNTAGQPFNLNCTATIEGLIDTPLFTWLDMNSMTVPSGGGDTRMVSTVMSSGSTHTSILQFDPLQSSHAGTYTCQVSVGSVTEMRSIDIPVVAPSISVVVHSSSPTTGEGYALELTCTVSGADQLSPIITYQWFKTNPETQVGTNSPILFFAPLRMSNAGQYRCDVTVSSAYLRENITTISEIEDLRIMIPTPVMTISSPGAIFVGSSPTLTCRIELSEAVDIDVTVNTVWSGPSGTQLTTTTPAVLYSNTTYTSTATLSSVETSDSGVYTCRATVSPHDNSFVSASDESSGMETITIVPGVPTTTMEQPTIMSTTTQETTTAEPSTTDSSIITTTVAPSIFIFVASITESGNSTAGQSYTLSCMVFIDGPVDMLVVTWSEPSGLTIPTSDEDTRTVTPVMSSGFYYTTMLHFDPLQLSQAGLYTCTVRVGSVRDMSQINVTIDAPPITVNVSRGNTTAGPRVSLVCTVTGADHLNPVLTYMWFKISPDRQVGTNSSTLLIASPGLSDAGLYRCDVIVSSLLLEKDLIVQSDLYELTIPAMLMQLHIQGIPDCQVWVSTDTTVKINEVLNTLTTAVEQECQCGFTREHITDDAFQCFPGSETHVTFRARIIKTPTATSTQVISHIEQWISITRTITIQNIRYGISDTCSAAITDFGSPECRETVYPLPQSEGSFQLKFAPTEYCINWNFNKAMRIQQDIHMALLLAIARRCQCPIPKDIISDGVFSCQDSLDQTTYRSTIAGTQSYNATVLVEFIQDWVYTRPNMAIEWYSVRVDHTCQVSVSSLNSPECGTVSN